MKRPKTIEDHIAEVCRPWHKDNPERGGCRQIQEEELSWDWHCPGCCPDPKQRAEALEWAKDSL